jgi:hypothetical protein
MARTGSDDFEYSNASRIAGVIIPIVLLVLVIGFVALMVFSPLARDAVLSPFREFEMINEMLPEEGARFAIRQAVDIVEYDEDGEPIQPPPAELQPAEVQELQRRITQLEAQLEASETALTNARNLNTAYESQIADLRSFEAQIGRYNLHRRQFIDFVAHGHPREFNEWFRYAFPDRAAQIYERTLAMEEIDREFRRFAQPYRDMDADAFATFAENMLPANPELLIRIMQTKNSARLAAVFEEMNPEILPTITQLMEPQVDQSLIMPDVPLILPPEITPETAAE